MEKELGRKLSSIEVVHHINGDHNDNRIENLQLYANQQEHSLIHHGKTIEEWLRENREETFKRIVRNLSRVKKPFKL